MFHIVASIGLFLLGCYMMWFGKWLNEKMSGLILCVLALPWW